MDDLTEIPPHDAVAEWGLLAGVLCEAEATYRETWRTGFRAEDFYVWRHRLVWGTAIGALDAGRVVTPAEVWRRLGYQDCWKEWEGDTSGRRCGEWIGDVLSIDPTGCWAPRFAAIVHDLAIRRQSIHRARAEIRDAYAGRPRAEIGF